MLKKDTIKNMEKYMEDFEEVEFRNVNFFTEILSFERTPSSIDPILQIIDLIHQVDIFFQKIKPALCNNQKIDLRFFYQYISTLKKELDDFVKLNLAQTNE